MRKFVSGMTAALFVMGGLAIASPAQADPGPPDTKVPMNTGQEASPVTSGASGSFTYEISGDSLCYTISAKNLSEPAVAAHIHLSPRNVAGGVVVPLMVPNETAFVVSHCTTADVELLADIDSSGKAYYVNVHTSMYPAGEVRGQLR